MPILSAAQLTAARKFAKLAMNTPITIQRRTLTDSVYGDKDATTYVTVATVKGYFYSKPTQVANAASGSLSTINTYRLLVPVGTNIKAGDVILVSIDQYVVSDTTAESTWLAYLEVSLRKRE